LSQGGVLSGKEVMGKKMRPERKIDDIIFTNKGGKTMRKLILLRQI